MLWVREVAVWVRRRAGQVGEHGSEVHAEILEGTAGYAATAGTVGDLYRGRVLGWDAVEGLVGAAGETVTAHAGLATIENGRGERVGCPLGPVIIGLVPIVTALVAECLFVGPSKEAVPP